jgi:pyruvate,water dikinase
MGAMVRGRPEVIARLAAGDRTAVDATPELRLAFDRYIAKFGDRCTQELKLESRTLHEDPTQVLMAVAAAAPARGAEAVQEAKQDLHRLIPDFGKRVLARWLVDWAKARVRDRENLRFERTRLFGRVRRIFLALGARLSAAGVLEQPRDVFNLTVEELLGAVEGAGITQDLKALVRLRAAEHAGQIARPDPPERFSVSGAHVTGVAGLTAQAGVAGEGTVGRQPI